MSYSSWNLSVDQKNGLSLLMKLLKNLLGEKGLANMLWPGFEASWPLMITPDQAVFAGPEKDMLFHKIRHT